MKLANTASICVSAPMERSSAHIVAASHAMIASCCDVAARSRTTLRASDGSARAMNSSSPRSGLIACNRRKARDSGRPEKSATAAVSAIANATKTTDEMTISAFTRCRATRMASASASAMT